jgi:hypothetical protein
LHPGGEPTPAELSEYMGYAVEGRRRVKEQMNKRKADDEFGLINLSYFDHHNQEVIVFCPESKNAQATQHPQRKSLPGVINRSVDVEKPEPVDNATPSSPAPAAEPVPATSAMDETPIAELLRAGESSVVEFKSSLRINLHTKNPDHKIEHAVLKTLAGFLNTNGGTLVVGADDKGTPLGVEHDGFASEDKLIQHLANLIRDRLGVHHNLFIESCVMDCEGKRLLVITCKPAKSAAYVKDGKSEYFYVRSGTTTVELPASKIHDYVKQRFG